MTIITIIIIILMITCSSILSATETAITSSSPGKIQKLKLAGYKKANKILQILKVKERVISSILIGNSIINTVCTTIATGLFIEILGDDLGTIVASTVMSFIIIVFAEVIPKAIAVAKAESISLSMVNILLFLLKILYPINNMLAKVVKIFCKITFIDLKQNISVTDEVRGFIEHHYQEGNVFKSARDMLGSILDIRDMTVSEIIIHRSSITSIEVTLPLKEIIQQSLSSNYSKIPLWQDSSDNIVGILPVKKLLTALYSNDNDLSKIELKKLIIQPWFIPDNALISHQLNEFKTKKESFAIVVNEYGDLKGIITVQDILDEIVGKISNEQDNMFEEIVELTPSKFLIEGSTTIRDINRKLNWNLSDENASTIAGFILNEIMRVPDQNEKLIIENMEIIIQQKLLNQIKLIQITLLPRNVI